MCHMDPRGFRDEKSRDVFNQFGINLLHILLLSNHLSIISEKGDHVFDMSSEWNSRETHAKLLSN